MDIFVFIYLPGQTKAVPAGLFEYAPDQSLGMFRYGNRYLLREDALPVDQEILQLFLHGSSLGGARPQCVIGDQGGLWLAKFPDVQDRWNHARIEWATMLLAKKCKVIVPAMRILSTQMGDVLLSRRFDRDSTARGFFRHGYPKRY